MRNDAAARRFKGGPRAKLCKVNEDKNTQWIGRTRYYVLDDEILFMNATVDLSRRMRASPIFYLIGKIRIHIQIQFLCVTGILSFPFSLVSLSLARSFSFSDRVPASMENAAKAFS